VGDNNLVFFSYVETLGEMLFVKRKYKWGWRGS